MRTALTGFMFLLVGGIMAVVGLLMEPASDTNSLIGNEVIGWTGVGLVAIGCICLVVSAGRAGIFSALFDIVAGIFEVIGSILGGIGSVLKSIID